MSTTKSGTGTRNWILVAIAGAAALAAVLFYIRDEPQPQPTPQATEPAPLRGPVRIQAQDAPPMPVRASRQPIELSPAKVERKPELPRGLFEGQVLDRATSEGVPGAELTFSYGDTAVSARCDQDGYFRFEPPETGLYRIATVLAPGYLPFAPDWDRSPLELSARPGLKVSGIAIYITPAINYTGVVLSKEGEPVAGAQVQVGTFAGEQSLIPLEGDYQSGSDGTFTFNAPDGAVIEATHPEYGRGWGVLGPAEQISHRLEITLNLEPAPEANTVVAGRVLDESGAPIAGARLSAVPGRTPGPNSAVRGDSGPDGRFQLAPVSAVEHSLIISADGYAERQLVVRGGQTGIDVVLQSGGRIVGRVVDDGGSPVGSFTAVAMRDGGPLMRIPAGNTTVFDGDGQFTIDGLPPGPYFVVASAKGLARSEEVPAQATTDGGSPVEIRLSAGGSVTGRVVDARTGAALVRARVSAEGTVGSGNTAVPVARSAVTDDSGNFELSGMRPGRRSLMVAAHNHHSRIESVSITSGQKAGPIHVELTPLEEGERPQLELAGIGVALAPTREGLAITRVLPGSGAQEAGLAEGDVILEVDDEEVVKLGFEGAIQRIRGPVDSSVDLRIKQRDDGKVVKIVTFRRKIRT